MIAMTTITILSGNDDALLLMMIIMLVILISITTQYCLVDLQQSIIFNKIKLKLMYLTPYIMIILIDRRLA